MKQRYARICVYALLATGLAVGVAGITTSNNFALAQPCQATLGSPNVSTQQYYYYNGNFQVTVPVSASCSFYAGQLYATGTAYDTTFNTNLGSTSAVLTSTYGGYGYSGQLTFTFPTSTQSHSVQFSVSIYSSQGGYYYGGPYGSLLAQTTSTFVVGPSYYQGYPTYPYYSTPTYPTYPTYPSYPYYSYYPSYSYYPGYYNSYYYYYHNGGWYYYGGGYYHHYCRSWSYGNNYCSQH